MMITPQRLAQLEEELMSIQHELQNAIVVDTSVQSTVQYYQNKAVTGVNQCRQMVNAIAAVLNSEG